MRKDRIKAINLRKQGKSYSQIKRILTIPKSTLSYWLKDIKISKKADLKIKKRARAKSRNALIARNKRQSILAKERSLKIIEIAKLEAEKFSNTKLFIAGVSLYWAEGYKKGAYGSKWKTVDFANTDPKMILVMMKFFREICEIDNEKIKIQLIRHKNSNSEKAIKFWSKITAIPEKQFIKSYIPNRKNKIKRNKQILQYGTIHLRIYDVKIFFRIIGWVEWLSEHIIN